MSHVGNCKLNKKNKTLNNRGSIENKEGSSSEKRLDGKIKHIESTAWYINCCLLGSIFLKTQNYTVCMQYHRKYFEQKGKLSVAGCFCILISLTLKYHV